MMILAGARPRGGPTADEEGRTGSGSARPSGGGPSEPGMKPERWGCGSECVPLTKTVREAPAHGGGRRGLPSVLEKPEHLAWSRHILESMPHGKGGATQEDVRRYPG